MNIQFFAPFSSGWKRMTQALFRPFQIGKWFVLGFTVFLAKLLDGSFRGSGFRFKDKNHLLWKDIVEIVDRIQDWILEYPGWFTLIIIGFIFAAAILILLLWISSRGKFMFLDNVVYDRALISEPWYRFRAEGNSLFLWRLVFGLIMLGVIIVFAVVLFATAFNFINNDFEPAKHIPPIVGFGLLAFLMTVVVLYIVLFLNDFVVPIMYIHRRSAVQAWGMFLKIFSRHWIYFILYGLLILILHILVVFAVVMIGFFTCCFGFVLLVIPYIGSVVLLPVSYTFRAFSLEFLEQFGPEFKIFPQQPEPAMLSEE